MKMPSPPVKASKPAIPDRLGNWKALEREVLRRDPLCRMPGCGRPSSQAEHIRLREAGGIDAVKNLRGVCEAHGRN
jgi:hypothetical protein